MTQLCYAMFKAHSYNCDILLPQIQLSDYKKSSFWPKFCCLGFYSARKRIIVSNGCLTFGTKTASAASKLLLVISVFYIDF